MKKIIASFICLLFVGLNTLLAHNLWIETPSTGKTGKEQIAKIYLGGYGENERDSTSKWFGNTKEFTLWLTEPNGTKKQLTTKAAGNYFEANFTPDKEGVYTLSLALELSDVYSNTKYKYHAATQVAVGSVATGQNNLIAATDLSAQLLSGKTAGKAIIKIQYKGKNLDKTGASVASPAGWVKSFETKQDGTFSFDVVWPGLYVMEVFYTEKEEGTIGEQKYTSISHIAAYSITLGK